MNTGNIDALRQRISAMEKSSDAGQKPNVNNLVDKCFKRMVVLINYRERCCEELRQRLVGRENFDKDVFEKALNKAKRYGLVDDARYAEMYAFCKAQCFRGVYGIEQHLRRMKIDFESIPKVMQILEKARLLEEKTAKEFVATHPSTSKNQFNANVKKLIHRGFSTEVAFKAANAYQRK